MAGQGQRHHPAHVARLCFPLCSPPVASRSRDLLWPPPPAWSRCCRLPSKCPLRRNHTPRWKSSPDCPRGRSGDLQLLSGLFCPRAEDTSFLQNRRTLGPGEAQPGWFPGGGEDSLHLSRQGVHPSWCLVSHPTFRNSILTRYSSFP